MYTCESILQSYKGLNGQIRQEHIRSEANRDDLLTPLYYSTVHGYPIS